MMKRLKDMNIPELYEQLECLREQRPMIRANSRGLQRRVALMDNLDSINKVNAEVRIRRLNSQRKIAEAKPIMRPPKQHVEVTLKSFLDIPSSMINRLKRRGKGMKSEAA